MTKYQEVENAIRRSIFAGAYREGARLPNMDALSLQYHVSNVTIRRALNELAAQGLIIKHRGGAGSYVKPITTWNREHADEAGRETRMLPLRRELVRFEQHAPRADVAAALMVSVRSEVYEICQAYCEDEDAVVLETSQLPARLFPGLTPEELGSSVEAYVEQRLQASLCPSESIVRARLATAAERQLLAIPVAVPVMEIEQVRYLADGRPCIYARRVRCGAHAALHTVTRRA